MGEVIVFGDPRLIIQALDEGNKSKNDRIARMIKRIRTMVKSFRKINIFHIFWNLNVLADVAANKSMVVGLHELVINSVVSIDIPP